jgi:hypothetical protein
MKRFMRRGGKYNNTSNSAPVHQCEHRERTRTRSAWFSSIASCMSLKGFISVHSIKELILPEGKILQGVRLVGSLDRRTFPPLL